ncbi:MAG: rhomboid family intramembrane serine protease [Bacteroidota bacterium]|nr:rhomboid family intramembrane serine protease [Bacteroidota bacterium]
MFKKQNIVIKLLIVNLAVFLVINLFYVILFLFKGTDVFDVFLGFLTVPSDVKKLLFRFWTPFTYMFVQSSFWHIFGNMLWLYFLGLILLRFINEDDFFALYILGGLSGAAMFILAFNLFPVFSDAKIFSKALGASASVTAIVIALATMKPKEEIHLFGLVKIKMVYIAIFILIYDFFLLTSDNAGGHFAHFGGAIYGYFFGKYYSQGKNIQEKFAQFLGRVFSFDFRPKTKFTVIKNNLHSRDDLKYNKTKTEIKNEIDRILDKISRSGYKSLSKKEKNFLIEYGDKYK